MKPVIMLLGDYGYTSYAGIIHAQCTQGSFRAVPGDRWRRVFNAPSPISRPSRGGGAYGDLASVCHDERSSTRGRQGSLNTVSLLSSSPYQQSSGCEDQAGETCADDGARDRKARIAIVCPGRR